MSHGQTHENHHPPTLKDDIKKACGENVFKCYQCGKCSAGCPLAEEMDIKPSQVLRMVQTGVAGHSEKVLSSFAIWLCLTCETCVARCPQEVDLPKIMDYLRERSMREGKINPKAKEIVAFHKSFLDSIKYTGRLYEIGLVGGYKTRTMHFLQDVLLAPVMFLKGKLGIFPHVIKGCSKIRRIFDNTIGKRGDKK